jgi:hypothetical protein
MAKIKEIILKILGFFNTTLTSVDVILLIIVLVCFVLGVIVFLFNKLF